MSSGQCTLPSCDNPVADERAAGGLCETHLNGHESPADESDREPGPEITGPWADADFQNPETDVWATDRLEKEQWMGHNEKKPFAPWGDSDAPAECSKDGHTTADKCGCDARYKWGYTGHYVDGETLSMYEDDPRFRTDGRVFLQQTDDEYGFVDGDDVRDSESGTVHPAFIAILNRLGISYADVSFSDSGVHVPYKGELPEDVKQAAWQLDTEPWGGNDDLPSIEIYSRKHVCVDTGKHVPGTPTETCEWDDDALLDVLDENDQLPDHPPIPDSEQFDSSTYNPETTSSDETASDIRDVFTALDRLNTHRVADKTIVHRWNDAVSTSSDTRAFYPVWGKNSNGTANVVNDKVWFDTGEQNGYGGPVVMALIDAGEMNHRGASPRDTTGADWWTGVEHLRDLGFDIPELDESAQEAREIVATLPNSPRTRAATNGQNWHDDRHASSQSTAPTQQELYDRVRAEQVKAMERGKNVVLDAIMGGGKTFNFFGALAEVGEKGAYFAPRIKLYEQAVEYAEANGFTRDECKILPSLKRDCPTWKGEHGEEQEHLIKKLYALGATPKTIHHLLGDELKCKQNDTGKCEYEHKCKFDPDEYELLIGHYAHAHVTQYTKGRHCAFDEDPQNAFTTHVSGSQLIKGVNAFLGLHESPPFDGWDDLIQHRNDDERKQQALAWFDRPGFEFEPDEQNAVRYADEGFHAYAPLAVYTILKSEPLEDGYPFEQAQLPGLGEKGKFFTTSEQDGEHYVEISNPPDLEYTEHKGLICLDGTPLIHDGKPVEWMDALDRPLNHRQVLTDDERGEFLSETQGNVYIQTSEYIKPYSSGRYNNPTEDAALLAAVRETYGDGEAPVVFTDMAVRNEYESAGFVEEGLAKLFDHPGNLRGNDEYGSERVAVQLGSSHHGDHEVRRRAASLGESVNPEGKGKERDYGSELGNSIVYQMREAQSAQNALRVGRDGNGALFVFDTCAFPDWIPVEEGVADVSMWSKTEQAIREVWGEFDESERSGGVRPSDVSEAIGDIAMDRQTRNCLTRLADRGYLEKTDDPDDGRRTLYADTGLGDIGEYRAAEIELPELETDGGDFKTESAGSGNPRYSSLYVKLPYLRLHHTPTSGSSLEATNRAGTAGGSAPTVEDKP